MNVRRRLLLLYVVAMAALVAIWLRVGWLQLIGHDAWVREAALQRERRWDVGGPRGRIVDADGVPLAVDRAAVRLVFMPGEWAARERFRCTQCGAVAARRTPRWFGLGDVPAVAPSRCACGARRDAFESLPPEDLAPLEDALGLAPGTLAGAAEDRMRQVLEQVEIDVVESVAGLVPGAVRRLRGVRRDELGRDVAIDEILARYKPVLEGREFYAEDLRFQRRADLFGRPVPMTVFRAPSGARLEVKTLSPEAERLLELDRDGRYRGWRAEPHTERWYPRHGLLAQCVGIVTPFREGESKAYWASLGLAQVQVADVRVGRIGLEAAYETALRGTPGRVRAARDDDGLFTVRTVVERPRRGDDVRLHLSVAASEQAYALLKEAATDDGYGGEGPASGGFVAMDAETGAVLAWAETPLFDPNGDVTELTTRIDEDEAVDDATNAARAQAASGDVVPEPPKPALTLSRVARLSVEPGSSMKIVSAMALLHADHALPGLYACAGASRAVEPKFPKCHPHAPVDLVGALALSCNRYFADMASDREHRGSHLALFPAWAGRFGLGQRTGLDFAGEGAGIYPRLDAGRLRQVAIGQAVTATPIQMARVAAAVANGRYLPIPRLAATVGGRAVEGGGVPLDVDAAALEQVRAGMRACVTRGTASKTFAATPLPGVTVWGKTGTATVTGVDWLDGGEDWVDEASTDAPRGKGPWHLWFVGYASKPGERTLAYAVVLHSRRKGAGGDDAAPVVAKFLAWWYGR